MNGFDTSIYLIGNKGSGKTHTLFGVQGAYTLSDKSREFLDSQGIIPSVVKEVFKRAESSNKVSNFVINLDKASRH
jgi:hypothetical protein